MALNASIEGAFGDGYSWDEFTLDAAELALGLLPCKTDMFKVASAIGGEIGNAYSLFSSGSNVVNQ